MHTSRFLTEFTGNNSEMPCYFLPCWVISWPDKVHNLFSSHQKSKDNQYKFTALNKSMAEVKCRSERDQGILLWNPLSFVSHNIKNVDVVCRFFLVSQ